MPKTDDICAKCGGEYGIHHYTTLQCPVGGVEAPIGWDQEWNMTTFTELPFDPPPNLAKDMTKREAFAMAAMQGILAAESDDYGYTSKEATADAAAGYADALIEALNKEPK